MRLDPLRIAQCILYNYPVNRPSLLSDTRLSAVLPQDIPRNHNADIIQEFKRVFEDIISKASGDIGLLMSSGYDSRLILSILLSFGKKPILITWTNRNPFDETGIVHDIAKSFGLENIVLDNASFARHEFLDSAIQLTVASEGGTPLSRTKSMIAVKKCRGLCDTLLWGEGEQIRMPQMPGEVFSANLLKTISSKLDGIAYSDNWVDDLPYSSAVSHAKTLFDGYRACLGEAAPYYWQRYVASESIYRGLEKAANEYIETLLPYLDERIISSLTNSEYCYSNNFGRFPFMISLSSLRLYYELLSHFAPSLLRFSTHRGYPPKVDRIWPLAAIANLRWRHRRRCALAAKHHLNTLSQSYIRDYCLSFSHIPFVSNSAREAIELYPIPWDAHMESRISKMAQIAVLESEEV